MDVVVCIKQVPDSWAEKQLSPGDLTLDRASAEAVLNDLDEYAVEAALQLVEAHGGQVTVLTMGPDRAGEAIRKALSMGPDAGVHVVDDALHGSDALATSAVLATALGTLTWDLVLLGCESTDARMSVIPAMLAERLGRPQLTYAATLAVDGSTVTAERQTETGIEVLRAELPAVVSLVEKANEPRYPSFKNIMAAKKKPVTTLTLADLGIDPAQVGLSAAWSRVEDAEKRPPKPPGVRITDEGDGGRKLVEYLVSQQLV
ncbi:MAG TPA: electron transfer flavoprotein subunit beta/FixA family protein [Actinomycetes bacterium]|nr:electron transfer flavoprotein subunit beta/FixA family protein [Actinomycetes bacterium]